MTSTERHPEPDRCFGRDGISGLLDASRAVRAREVSRPSEAELLAAEEAAKAAVARLGPARRQA